MLTQTACTCTGTNQAKLYARDYARFVRMLKSPKTRTQIPAELITAWDANTVAKGDVFKTFVDKKGDWLEVCYTFGLKIRSVESCTNHHGMATRAMMLVKYDAGSTIAKLHVLQHHT